jgi:hypothetical protein
MEVLDAMQVRQRKSKTFPLFGSDKFIDIDRVNWLIALSIATTVAKGLPASSKTGKKDVSHDGHPYCGVEADGCRHAYERIERPPAPGPDANAAAGARPIPHDALSQLWM